MAKLFKDVEIGEKFVLNNGQQLIRVASIAGQTHNCIAPTCWTRFFIEDDTECLTVEELFDRSDMAE